MCRINSSYRKDWGLRSPLYQMYTYLALIWFDQYFADLKVKHLIVPSTGQNIITKIGQGVSHKEISISQDQRLWHLKRRKSLA